MTVSDLDLINADLMGGGVRNAFGKNVNPGDQLTGEIVAVERRHRTDNDGRPLYWVDRKPSPIEAGRAVMDNVLIVQTDIEPEDDDDDGQRSLRLDRDVKTALVAILKEAGVKGVALGGRIEGFMYVSPAENGSGRIYDGGTYTPPAG